MEGKDSRAVGKNEILLPQLYIPRPHPKLVLRPRLITPLRQVEDYRLILISAPAGFGKTTLLSQWLADPECQHHRERVGWVSLEGNLNLIRFWIYLISAVEAVDAGTGRVAMGLIDNTQPQVQKAITVLINSIAEANQPFLLILDDYDVIEDPEVHASLAFLLDHLPPNLHMVISSRIDPPLPLARLRLQRGMAELRAADLVFTLPETTALYNEVLGLNFSQDDLAALGERTEGWIAGLQAAALALQSRMTQSKENEFAPAARPAWQAAHDFIQEFTGSQRYILDYLVEEVLRRQPQHVQAFLLETSILDRLCGSLCDAVTGRDDSQSILEDLETANVFIIPLDEEASGRAIGRWYRYHRLFADVLRHQFQVALPGSAQENHRRASCWYETQGMFDEAIEHALAARDFSRAEDLLEPVIGQIIDRQGRLHQAVQWLESLPADRRRDHPQLNFWYALVLMLIGRGPDHEVPLREAEAAWRVQEDRAGLAKVASLRAHAACRRGDFDQTALEASQALSDLPEDDLILRCMTQYALGVACRAKGDLLGANQAIDQARQVSAKAGSVILNLLAETASGNLLLVQGRLRQAAETYREVIRKVGQRTFHPRIEASLQLGDVYREWNELEPAEDLLREGVRLAEVTGWEPYLAQGLLSLARVVAARERGMSPDGQVDDLLDRAAEIGRRLGRQGVMDKAGVLRARRSLSEGSLAAAVQWAAQRGFSLDDAIPFEQEMDYLTWARVLIAQGKTGETVRVLEQIRSNAQQAGRGGAQIETLALQALACQVEGRTDQALAVAAEALLRAEPEGYLRTFLDEGPPMAALVQQAGMRGITPAYTGRLLAAFKEAHLLSKASPIPVTAALVEPLSARELEIVQLLARGATNQEIAQQLSIALTTAKKHVSNIIGKLGVSNRAQVAARARDLGLIF